MINWDEINVSKEDHILIGKIATRADDLDRLSTIMDLEVVHGTIGLKLEELLAADRFNFFHDVVGIKGHLNRETGELEDCFLLRFHK